MSDITMEELKAVAPLEERVEKRCVEIMKWFNNHDDDGYYVLPDDDYHGGYGNSIRIIICEDSVDVRVSEDWSYGGHEDHYYNFPFEWIINDDWQEDFLKKIEEKKLVKEQKRKLEEENKRRETKERERKEYERLKTMYEMGLLD